MVERVDVFVSSTSRDLVSYRQSITNIILRLGCHPIIMEAFNPTDRNALQLCYDKVQQAEVFIGIYAHRYGYVPAEDDVYVTQDGRTMTGDGETSITHWEYLWAMERQLPVLLYVVGETDIHNNPLTWPVSFIDEEPNKSRLQRFKHMIMNNHVVDFFSSPDNLAAKVATGLAETREQLYTMPSTAGIDTSASTGRCDFYKHVPLPPNYIPRHDLLAELLLELLGDDDIALTSAIKGTTALHGMGGVGKSVMARALCDEAAVQTAFPGGILWTTLGQEPTLSAKLLEWIDALGGSVSDNDSTVDSLKANLAELLDQRQCLLIVDDVWHKKHAEVFRVAGKQCRLLITTRDAEVARSIGADIQPIPTMSVNEAIDLLKEWAGDNLASADRQMLKTIIDRLGRLPLAIKLAGAQLQRKSPERWLERFNARKLSDRRSAADDVHGSLENCFRISLAELRETERKLYAALAIFQEDEPIREVAICRLWEALDDLDEDDTEDLLDDLAARALLEVIGEEYPRAAVLHDLLRDFIGDALDDPRTTHVELINAYRMTQQGDGWHTAPNDEYLYDHLVYHLDQAGLVNEMIALLLNFSWIQTRLRVNDIISLLSDYELALKAEKHHNLEQVRDALRLSAHVLSADESQLPSQLVGRLLSHASSNSTVATFLQQVRSYHAPWLEPLTGSLMQVGRGLYRTLRGLPHAIWTVAISQDSSLIAAGDEQGHVGIWEVATGDEISGIRGAISSTPIAEVLISNDNRYVFIGSRDGSILKWNIREKQIEEKILDASNRTVWAMALTANGRYLTVAYSRGEMAFIDIETGVSRQVKQHTENIWCLNASYQGDYIASASVDKTIAVWNCRTGELLHQLMGHTRAVYGVIFTADDQQIISASSDSTIRVWDWRNERELDAWQAHDLAIWGVGISQDGSILVSGGVDRMIKIWSMPDHDPQMMRAIEGHTIAIWDLVMSADDRFAVTGSEDATIRVWQLDAIDTYLTPEKHSLTVFGLAMSSDGLSIASASADHRVKLWDAQTQQVTATLQGHSQTVWSVDFSTDQRYLLSASADNTAIIWDRETGDIIQQLPNDKTIRRAVFSHDSQYVILGGSDRTVRIWDWQAQQLLHTLTGHTGGIKDLAISKSGVIATASADGTLCLWNLTGECMRTLHAHDGWVRAVDIDDTVTVSGADDGKLIWWETETGDIVRTVSAHEGPILDVHINQQTGHVLSVSLDEQIKVWNHQTGDIVTNFIADDRLHSVIAGDNSIVIGGRSGKLYFLRLHGIVPE